jgi:hypothetical protein
MGFLKAIFIAGLATILASCGGGGGCSSSASCTSATSSVASTTTFTASPASAVSVAIGQGDTIETTAQEIKYKKRFAVTVSDANGLPVVGAKVTAKVIMSGFYKGRFFRNSTTLAITGYGVAQDASQAGYEINAGDVQFCQSEDINRNEINDPGEDVNGDGHLTPAKAEVVASVEGADVTNSQGIVYVVAEYYKSSATWVEFELVASANVTGTEGTASRFQRTSYVVGDEIKASTQFVYSPFGVTAGCTNRF